MSPAISFPGKHFSQIFCNSLNYNLEIYARSGMSNGGIAVQLNSAIKKKPDLIIFNTTSFDRIEIPTKYNFRGDGFGRNFYPYEVTDLLYTQSSGLSTHYPWVNKDPKLWSIGIADLLNFTVYDSSKDKHYNHNSMVNLQYIDDLEIKQKVAKDWFMFLYDETMKKTTDIYMMYGVMHQLLYSKIDFLYVHDAGCFGGRPVSPFDILPKKNIVTDEVGSLIHKYRSTDFDPGFHTTFEGQEHIAQFLLKHHQDYFLQQSK